MPTLPVAALGVGYHVFNQLAAEDGSGVTIDAVARPVPPYAAARGEEPVVFFTEMFKLEGARTELFAAVDPSASSKL